MLALIWYFWIKKKSNQMKLEVKEQIKCSVTTCNEEMPQKA